MTRIAIAHRNQALGFTKTRTVFGSWDTGTVRLGRHRIPLYGISEPYISGPGRCPGINYLINRDKVGDKVVFCDALASLSWCPKGHRFKDL